MRTSALSFCRIARDIASSHWGMKRNVRRVPESFDLRIRIEDEHELKRQTVLSARSIENGDFARLASSSRTTSEGLRLAT